MMSDDPELDELLLDLLGQEVRTVEFRCSKCDGRMRGVWVRNHPWTNVVRIEPCEHCSGAASGAEK